MEILSSRVIIRPADPATTTAFYRDTLGLAVYREFPGGTVFFAGNGLVEVSAHADPDDAVTSGNVVIWLQMRDVEDAVAGLATRGVAIDRAPKREPWGLIEAWIHDPDGTKIVLVQIPADHPLRKDTR